MDRDWLYDQYVTKDRSSEEIAEEYGCKQNTIQCWLAKHQIKKLVKRKPREKAQYDSYDYLYHQHIELHKSMAEIARENGVSGDTIRESLKRNGIERWRSAPREKITDTEKEQVELMYRYESMSANQIAKELGTSHGTVIRILKKRGVPTRNIVEAQYNANKKTFPEDFKDKDVLYSLHWENNLSCKDIGGIYHVDAGTVRRQMKRLGLPTKTNAESKIGLMTGNRHPNWRGGITPLNLLLREYFHINQAPPIARRDRYTCQLCGAQHTVLHVHHIRPFSDIVQEICSEHPELSPDNVDDRLSLYKIITSDGRFLDEDNLITLCKDCHFYKVHDYQNDETISSQASYEEGSETIPLGSTP